MSNYLTPVPRGTHTADDLEALLAADYAQPLLERLPLMQINHALYDGTMQLFRSPAGIILTELASANGVCRLRVIRGAGKFGVSGFKHVLKELSLAAKELGCECVETVVYSDRFQKALANCGVRTEGYIMTYTGE